MKTNLKVKLIAYTPNPDKVVASAAKLCYSPVGIDSIMNRLTEDNINKFVTHLAKIGHESPFEHATFTFGIEGISRSCSHQIVRHRIASPSQQSQRYVKNNQFEYIIPPQIEENAKAKELFVSAMNNSQEIYNEMFDILFEEKYTLARKELIESHENWDKLSTESKVQLFYNLENKIEKEVIEDCRYVFPNACETKMVFTINARSLFNFFNKRCCNRAQWEIRELANEMLKQVKEVAPNIFKYAGPPCAYKKCPEGNMTCGHPIKD